MLRFVRFGSDPHLTANGGGGRSRHRSRSSSRTGSDHFRDEEERPIKIMVHGAKRMVYPPTGGAYDTVREPSETLETDWVFGYNGRDVEVSARNLWTLKSGAILYSAGAIAVVFERSKGTGTDSQRHYTEHTDDIECMELHPEGDIVASGQRAGLTPHSGAHIRCSNSVEIFVASRK